MQIRRVGRKPVRLLEDNGPSWEYGEGLCREWNVRAIQFVLEVGKESRGVGRAFPAGEQRV